MAVCRACHAHKIRRLVITSSIAAVMEQRLENRPLIWTEEHWSDPEYHLTTSHYFLTMTLAEQAAWNFLKELPENEKFEIVTINPSLVVGKPLHTHAGFASAEIV